MKVVGLLHLSSNSDSKTLNLSGLAIAFGIAHIEALLGHRILISQASKAREQEYEPGSLRRALKPVSKQIPPFLTESIVVFVVSWLIAIYKDNIATRTNLYETPRWP